MTAPNGLPGPGEGLGAPQLPGPRINYWCRDGPHGGEEKRRERKPRGCRRIGRTRPARLSTAGDQTAGLGRGRPVGPPRCATGPVRSARPARPRGAGTRCGELADTVIRPLGGRGTVLGPATGSPTSGRFPPRGLVRREPCRTFCQRLPTTDVTAPGRRDASRSGVIAGTTGIGTTGMSRGTGVRLQARARRVRRERVNSDWPRPRTRAA